MLNDKYFLRMEIVVKRIAKKNTYTISQQIQSADGISILLSYSLNYYFHTLNSDFILTLRIGFKIN